MTPPVGFAGIVAQFGSLTDPLFELHHIVLFDLPYPLIFTNAAGVESMTRIARCHKLLVPTFVSVFQDIKGEGLMERATHYGGIYQRRNIRGGTHPSTHSWGISIDLNPQENALGTRGRMDPRVIGVFKAHGFTWGGDFTHRLDPMHFQFCTGY